MTAEGQLSFFEETPLTEDEEDAIIWAIVAKWRERGFPYYATDLFTRGEEWRRFMCSPTNLIDQDGIIKQTMAGLSLCWSYFPHAWEIRANRSITPMEIWESDDLMFQAVRHRLKRSGLEITVASDLSPAKMRKAFGSFRAQRVSNFRPTAARAIYDRYADGVVWDLSCGFGGRLLGAIASDRVTTYIGTDPSTKTYAGLLELSADFAGKTDTATQIHCQGSEDFTPEPNSLSLAFTSPPYFSTEQYAYEETQSFIRFPERELWNEGFLRKSIENAFIGLRSGGHLALNVADTQPHPTLEADTVRIALETGFTEKETLRLVLSAVSKGGFKYEPVFVFTKP